MFPFFTNQVNPFGTGKFNVRTGCIEQGITDKIFSLTTKDAEQYFLGSPALVCRDYQRHARNILDGFLKTEKTWTSGIGFVAMHDTCPLIAAHSTGTAVCQQINEYIRGTNQERI